MFFSCDRQSGLISNGGENIPHENLIIDAKLPCNQKITMDTTASHGSKFI